MSRKLSWYAANASLSRHARPSATRLLAPWSGRKFTAMPNTITIVNGRLQVPDAPVIPFIEGDGTGPDIWRASQRVFDAAVEKAYGGKRAVKWFEIYAGE